MILITFQKRFMDFITKEWPYLRLFPGERVNKGIEVKFTTRNIFFNSIKNITPEVIDDLIKFLPLFKEVFNKYTKTLNITLKNGTKIFKDNKIINKKFNMSILLLYADNNPIALKLIHKIAEWGDKYNLTDIWILDSAIQILSLWNKNEKHRKEKSFFYMGNEYYLNDNLLHEGNIKYLYFFDPLSESDKYINTTINRAVKALAEDKNNKLITLLPIPVFNPYIQTKKEHKKEVLKRLKEYQEKKIHEIDNNKNFEKITEKDQINHFDWLVSYQIEELSYREVAIKYGKDKYTNSPRSSIRKGVIPTAELIGLTIR